MSVITWEVVGDHFLINQAKSSTHDNTKCLNVEKKEEQNEPRARPIKDEEIEVCIIQDEEQADVKPKADTCAATPSHQVAPELPQALVTQQINNRAVEIGVLQEGKLCEVKEKTETIVLKRHQERRGIHEVNSDDAQDRNFSCHVCGKCFAKCTYLTDHMRTHSGKVVPDHLTEERSSVPDLNTLDADELKEEMDPVQIKEEQNKTKPKQMTEIKEELEPQPGNKEEFEDCRFYNERLVLVKQETSTFMESPSDKEVFLNGPELQLMVVTKEEPEAWQVKEEQLEIFQDEGLVLVKEKSTYFTPVNQEDSNKPETIERHLLSSTLTEAEKQHQQDCRPNVEKELKPKEKGKRQKKPKTKTLYEKLKRNDT
ncbi:uncharacterized protein LOC119795170 isoform X2 [Cyprinodon tularosa]|uniref:uncharacterized protein LOC119795170 isoform X2 n=1 Tax=Cyprinodon tularosa TaxID=77115 RepID=UPI0018E27A87|nr:uncharacterized protein LOC119795170 isoform X2 [Cyprinodon tularosa]